MAALCYCFVAAASALRSVWERASAQIRRCCPLTVLAEILEPPFEVTEHGWGAFDIGITIVMRDHTVPPISLIHKCVAVPSSCARAWAAAPHGLQYRPLFVPLRGALHYHLSRRNLDMNLLSRLALLA